MAPVLLIQVNALWATNKCLIRLLAARLTLQDLETSAKW